jgi:hypothetical protein
MSIKITKSQFNLGERVLQSSAGEADYCSPILSKKNPLGINPGDLNYSLTILAPSIPLTIAGRSIPAPRKPSIS